MNGQTRNQPKGGPPGGSEDFGALSTWPGRARLRMLEGETPGLR